MRINGWIGVAFGGALLLAGCQGGGPKATHEQGRHAAEGSTMSESRSTVTFAVHGMHCGGCVNSIQTALKEQDGVIENSVDLAESTAVVTFDPSKVSSADLVAIIEELGYTAAEKK